MGFPALCGQVSVLWRLNFFFNLGGSIGFDRGPRTHTRPSNSYREVKTGKICPTTLISISLSYKWNLSIAQRNLLGITIPNVFKPIPIKPRLVILYREFCTMYFQLLDFVRQARKPHLFCFIRSLGLTNIQSIRSHIQAHFPKIFRFQTL